MSMRITIEIPDEVAAKLSDSYEMTARRALELIAVAAYCKGLIGSGGVGQMLGFSSRWETYDFLTQEDAEPPFEEADLKRDQATLSKVLKDSL